MFVLGVKELYNLNSDFRYLYHFLKAKFYDA